MPPEIDYFVTVVCNQLDEIIFDDASAEGRAMGKDNSGPKDHSERLFDQTFP